MEINTPDPHQTTLSEIRPPQVVADSFSEFAGRIVTCWLTLPSQWAVDKLTDLRMTVTTTSMGGYDRVVTAPYPKWLLAASLVELNSVLDAVTASEPSPTFVGDLHLPFMAASGFEASLAFAEEAGMDPRTVTSITSASRCVLLRMGPDRLANPSEALGCFSAVANPDRPVRLPHVRVLRDGGWEPVRLSLGPRTRTRRGS